MKTQLIDLVQRDDERLKICADIIARGGLVAFPTETVYGLGANAFDEKAVRSIYAAKNRPADNPLIVHISRMSMLEGIAQFDDERQKGNFTRLADKFWCGPLTMIVRKNPRIPDIVSCGLDTVGIRMPAHPVALALIDACGLPIAAPSANSSGKPSPTRFEHVFDDMNGKIDAIINGGECLVGVESTVLDLSGEIPLILRPGAVTREQISDVIGACDEADWHISSEITDAPRSPGMKYRHYAPKAHLSIFMGAPEVVASRIASLIVEEKNHDHRVGVLATDETICYYKDADVVFSIGGAHDSEAHAARLFDCLRDFDAAEVDVIYAEAVSENGVGDAVMNRLFRAAGGDIVVCE